MFFRACVALTVVAFISLMTVALRPTEAGVSAGAVEVAAQNWVGA